MKYFSKSIICLTLLCSACRSYTPFYEKLTDSEKEIFYSYSPVVHVKRDKWDKLFPDSPMENSSNLRLKLYDDIIFQDTDPYFLPIMLNIFTFGLSNLTGLPLNKITANTELRAEIYAPSGNVIKQLKYDGEGKAYTAAYYGYTTEDAVRQSHENATYDAVQKMLQDLENMGEEINQDLNEDTKKTKLKAIEKEKQAKLKAIENEKREKELDNFILNTVPNNVDEVFRHAWTKASKKDVFTKDEELTKENNLNKKKFEEWVKEKNGNTFLLFEEKAKIDTYTSDLEYNPNTEELTVIPDEIVPKGFLTLKFDSEGLGSYIGENAFGVKKEITRINYTTKRIDITNNNFKIRKRKKIKFSTEELRKISDHLKFLYVITSSGEVKYSSDYEKATISDPRETFTHEETIKGKIEQVYLYDALNKKIIMKMIER